MGFWTGLIIIVLTLEVVRIGLSSAVLIHVLRHADFNPGVDENSPQPARGQREMLRQQTILALRGAMDEINAKSPGERTRLAAETIGLYAEALVEEPAR